MIEELEAKIKKLRAELAKKTEDWHSATDEAKRLANDLEVKIVKISQQ